jgi:ABC-type dipeptide/oligopeptide/nickel transport system ATPase component
MALLEITGLRVEFPGRPPLMAVDGLDLAVEAGRTTALVGESGCGKSVSALAVLGLAPPPGRVVGGSILFEGRELLGAPARELRRVRGAGVALISQDPLAALNPVHSVGAQVAEAIAVHQPVGRAEAWRRAVEALAQVGLPDPQRRAHDYPHRLSGGQRQRVMIAMATACRPKLLIADEPTTALDVSVQAQILELLRRLQAEYGMALLLITHDLGVVAEMADEVTVIRRGGVVEQADVYTIFANPRQAYTRALLAAVPRLDSKRERLALLEAEDD